MKSAKQIQAGCCVLSFGLCLAAIGLVCDRIWDRINTPCPTIKVIPSQVDLGVIDRAQTVPFEFNITNIGHQPLSIHDVSPGCGKCIEIIRPPSDVIPPGQSRTIGALFQSSSTIGLIVKSITISSNDPVTPSVKLKILARIEWHGCAGGWMMTASTG